MTLRHRNRMRRNGGDHLVRELELTDAIEMAESGSTETEIRRLAHEIHQFRHGVSGNAELDWLRAEAELRTSWGGLRRDRITVLLGTTPKGRR